jgi:2,4-diaminopentanoate dehydrogenase
LDWKIEHGYVVNVLGMPRGTLKYEILPPPGFKGEALADFMVLGMVATSLPAVQAIPAVCDARLGVVTYLDLPVITARGFARR